MEEQITLLLMDILDKNLSNKIDMKILDDYYKLFDEKKYNMSNFDLIYKDMQDIYALSLSLPSLIYGFENTKEQETYQKLVQAILQTKEQKNKIKLIPLILYLDSNLIFYKKLDDIGFFNDFENLKEYSLLKIDELEIPIVLEDLSEYSSDRELYERYLSSLKNLEFKKINSYVKSFGIESTYYFNAYFDFLVWINYKFFFEEFIQFINKQTDMFKIIELIKMFSLEEILELANKSTNNLLKFEAIRKATYFKNNTQTCLNLLKNEQDMITNIIVNFSKNKNIWKQFLDFYLEYPLRNPQLFRPLAKAINKINQESIDLFTQTIKINNYRNNDSQEALNSCILYIKNDEIQKEVLEKLFYRWNNFIDNYNEYTGSILLTDIIDIVIVYVRDYLDKDLIVKNIEIILNNLDEMDNRWFKDKSEQTNYFYKQMSKIFVYGFALDKYKLFELKNNIHSNCNDSYLLKKEDKYNSKTTLKLFDEYIFNGVKNEKY